MSNGYQIGRNSWPVGCLQDGGAAPQIDAVRSTKGEMKGFFSQDTL